MISKTIILPVITFGCKFGRPLFLTNVLKHCGTMEIEKKLKNTAGKTKEEASILSLKKYAFSPRKTRKHIKVECEDAGSSCVTSINSQNIDEINSTESKKTTLKKNKKVNLKEKVQVQVKNTNVKRQNLSCGEEDGAKEEKSKNIKWEPLNWSKVLENLREMRSSTPAPVDTMGCDKCSDESADEKTKRFHILVALMLSSQTKDQITYEAMNRLKSNDLTPKSIVEMDSSTLEQLLKPVSFYKNKTKYLQKTTNILIEKYDSDIPKTVEELIKLPGVGSKMAHICMNSAWNIVSGIGVDVHVHRISNRLGWVKKSTKIPEDTRRELESWLPYEYWNEINHLMVGFGQTVCTAINPKCDICSNRDICPSANLRSSKSRK